MATVDGDLAESSQQAVALLVQLEPRLRRALVARYGVDVGCEVAAEAIAWGVEHADRLATMANPAGYLFRVGQSAARRLHRDRRRPAFPVEATWSDAPQLPGTSSTSWPA